MFVVASVLGHSGELNADRFKSFFLPPCVPLRQDVVGNCDLKNVSAVISIPDAI